MKILFFHLPILSIYNELEPVLLELQKRGHQVIHYNEARFRKHLHNATIPFIPYSSYEGYSPMACNSTMSLYELGLLLLETAEHVLDFVEEEVQCQSPDFILHSKFVIAAKIVANRHRLGAGCLTTDFVLQPRMIINEERKKSTPIDMVNVATLLQFRKQAQRFYEKHLTAKFDIEDAFINDEPLHLIFGFKEFQPTAACLAPHWNIVGPTIHIDDYAKSYELIYASLGAVFVNNKPFFEMCIQALGAIGRQAIISLGGHFSADDFKNVPKNVELCHFVRQKEVLQRAAVFITQGGGASLSEAIYCETPMIVIPQIPEQLFKAQQIERWMIGKLIKSEDMTVDRLTSTVDEILNNPAFRDNVHAFKQRLPISSAATACNQIEEFAATRRIQVVSE